MFILEQNRSIPHHDGYGNRETVRISKRHHGNKPNALFEQCLFMNEVLRNGNNIFSIYQYME